MHLIVIYDNDDKSHYRTIHILIVFDQVIALQWVTFPPKLPFLMGDLYPHLIHDSLGKSERTIQTAPRLVQLFSHR